MSYLTVTPKHYPDPDLIKITDKRVEEAATEAYQKGFVTYDRACLLLQYRGDDIVEYKASIENRTLNIEKAKYLKVRLRENVDDIDSISLRNHALSGQFCRISNLYTKVTAYISDETRKLDEEVKSITTGKQRTISRIDTLMRIIEQGIQQDDLTFDYDGKLPIFYIVENLFNKIMLASISSKPKPNRCHFHLNQLVELSNLRSGGVDDLDMTVWILNAFTLPQLTIDCNLRVSSPNFISLSKALKCFMKTTATFRFINMTAELSYCLLYFEKVRHSHFPRCQWLVSGPDENNPIFKKNKIRNLALACFEIQKKTELPLDLRKIIMSYVLKEANLTDRQMRSVITKIIKYNQEISQKKAKLLAAGK
jgi:hypothetical protein